MINSSLHDAPVPGVEGGGVGELLGVAAEARAAAPGPAPLPRHPAALPPPSPPRQVGPEGKHWYRETSQHFELGLGRFEKRKHVGMSLSLCICQWQNLKMNF